MAKFYDASMRKMEESCLREWRSELLQLIEGDVLEIGSGTGGNLRHYPESISSLVLTEPDPHMLKLLRKNLRENYSGRYRAEGFSADAINLPDHSFDSIVSTLVLCSVDSPDATLQEIMRLLKPGGKLYFIEHVLAKDTPGLIKWQKLLQPLWGCMCGNCHLTRDTENYILKAGFHFDRIERLMSSGSPAVVSPTIKGVASKASA